MKRILIATLIGFSVLTAACTGTTGNPTPTPTSGDSSTPTSDSNASSGLKSIKPCDLLTDSDVTSLGYQAPGEAEKVGTSDGCAWKGPDSSRIRTGIRADAGVKDLDAQGDTVSETKVGKFTATKVEAPNGAKSQCTILISVTESSSISVISTLKVTSEDTAASCERASKAADLVASKLP